MELGILSLGDLQRDQRIGRPHRPAVRTGRPHRPVDRMTEVLGYAVLADQLGLDVFALGEHHSAEFFTSSPAVVLAAAAARTTRIQLTSATTLLGVADPVRVYEDFASLDLISRGRAEVIVGRSAFVEPFVLFGYDTADYDALFAEKLGLLRDIRARENVTWAGRFRPPLKEAAVVPRAIQQPLPVWIGVGGSPDSAERAGRLGLPMVLGYIGGTLGHLRPLVDAYRDAGKLLDAVKALGLDRIFAQVDWGGLPSAWSVATAVMTKTRLRHCPNLAARKPSARTDRLGVPMTRVMRVARPR